MKNTYLLLPAVMLLAFCFSCNEINPDRLKDQVSSTTPKKTIILAIDGGGIKGVIPAYFLTLVEARINNTQSYKIFDVIGGTSTGGIISIGLTAPYNSNNTPRTATEILNLYMNDCSQMFHKNRQTEHWLPYGPSYYADSSGYGIEPYLKSIVSPTMSLAAAAAALPNKKVQQVFTTTYIINSSGGTISNPVMGKDFGPYLYNWIDAASDPTQDYYLWEAARSTGAAPTYFPVANVGGGQNGRSHAAERWAVDGGVMSNDPAVWAISEALRNNIASGLDDIVLISIGCGIDAVNGGIAVTNEEVNNKKGQKYGFWGSGTWVSPFGLENLQGVAMEDPALLEVAVYANQFVPVTQLDIIAANSGMEYCRVQPPLPTSLTPMDDCGNVSALHAFAVNYFSQGTGQSLIDSVVTMINNNL